MTPLKDQPLWYRKLYAVIHQDAPGISGFDTRNALDALLNAGYEIVEKGTVPPCMVQTNIVDGRYPKTYALPSESNDGWVHVERKTAEEVRQEFGLETSCTAEADDHRHDLCSNHTEPE